MSTKLSKEISKTPRNIVKNDKIDNTKTKNELDKILYDYEASPPDLTGFFKQSTTNFNCMENNEDKKSPEMEKKIFEKLASPKMEMKIEEKKESVRSFCPKSETMEKKICYKLATSKTSRIPRARFTAFSRMPVKNRGKKASITRLCPTKSKSVVADEAPQVQKSLDTRQSRENVIEDRRLSDEKITLVVSTSKSIFSEEKCSGIDGDVELDPDHEFTTSTDNSPGRFIKIADPSISSILRASKLSCACRSCNDPSSELPGHRAKPEAWTDSRSSPEVGRYASSGRNGRPKTRRLAEMSKSRGYLDDTTDESEIEPTTDFSIYEPNEKKRMKKRENLCDLPKPVGIVAKSRIENPSTRMKSRRVRFSFFNTLFDIVFWPFVFLRDDH